MNRARPSIVPLLAPLFALVSLSMPSSRPLTGMMFPAVRLAGHAGDVAVSAPAPTPAETSALQPPRPSGNDSPWQFFKESVGHADSIGKWLALIFFTTVLTALYVPRVLNSIVIAGVVLALVKPKVRNSQLVRGGFVLFALGWVALIVAGRFNDNPLGVGFLFAFSRPLAAGMVVLGAVQALLERTDTPLNRDIAALVASAESSRPIWPDEPPVPEVDRVATHGSRAGSALVALMGARNVHVEQQAALALCTIYRVLPTAGETVRDARATAEDSGQVNGFWRAKVNATKGHR